MECVRDSEATGSNITNVLSSQTLLVRKHWKDYFTGAHPNLSQCVDRVWKRFAFIKCSLVKCHINSGWLTEYVMFGFQLVCARTGVGRPPGSFLFWKSPGANPDHQNNTVSHSDPHALEEPDQLWLLWKSLKCGWSVQIFHKWWLWVLLDRWEQDTEQQLEGWGFDGVYLFVKGSGVWRECSKRLIPTQVMVKRENVSLALFIWWHKRRRPTRRCVCLCVVVFVFMRFVMGNNFSLITDVIFILMLLNEVELL